MIGRQGIETVRIHVDLNGDVSSLLDSLVMATGQDPAEVVAAGLRLLVARLKSEGAIGALPAAGVPSIE
jgi:hypothetical protein